MDQAPSEGTACLSLHPPDDRACGPQSVTATEGVAQAVEAASALGEALHPGYPPSAGGSVPDTIVIEKSSPVTQQEASLLESITSATHSGMVPKGGVAAHAQSAAAKGESRLEVPVNQEVAQEIQSLTSRQNEMGTVPKGSFASEVKSAADRLEHQAGAGLPVSGVEPGVSG